MREMREKEKVSVRERAQRGGARRWFKGGGERTWEYRGGGHRGFRENNNGVW